MSWLPYKKVSFVFKRACRGARHHGEPAHADQVQCTAARAPRRGGVFWKALVRAEPNMEKSAWRRRFSRYTVRARQRRASAGAQQPPAGRGGLSLEGVRGQ